MSPDANLFSVQAAAQAQPALIRARNHRQALDWSLVLASQGIEATLLQEPEGGFLLAVPVDQETAARSAIEIYQNENRRWRWQRRIPTTPLIFHWGSTGWVLVMMAMAALSVSVNGLYEEGRMSGSAVSAGQLWRLVTATMLHADAPHLLSNMMAGWLFIGVAMGLWGAGIALFSVLLAGMVGNLAGWMIYPPGYTGVGASGMVMGAIGLLAAAPAPRGSLRQFPLRLLARTITPALLLFVFYGFGPKPNTDWIAHTGGFVTGVVLGWLWRPWRGPGFKSLNQWLLWTSALLAAGCWLWAAQQIKWLGR
jgi:rhomboid protease GluP